MKKRGGMKGDLGYSAAVWDLGLPSPPEFDRFRLLTRSSPLKFEEPLVKEKAPSLHFLFTHPYFFRLLFLGARANYSKINYNGVGS